MNSKLHFNYLFRMKNKFIIKYDFLKEILYFLLFIYEAFSLLYNERATFLCDLFLPRPYR